MKESSPRYKRIHFCKGEGECPVQNKEFHDSINAGLKTYYTENTFFYGINGDTGICVCDWCIKNLHPKAV